jgi:hypothetical protein
MQIDRLLQLTAPGSDHRLEQIRVHTRSCADCAEYLDSAVHVEQMLLSLPEIEPCPDLCLRVMAQLTEQAPLVSSSRPQASALLTARPTQPGEELSCAETRLRIDRQPQVTAPGSDHKLEQSRAHARSCADCAEYLDSAVQVEQMLLSLPEIEPCPDLCLRVMAQLTEQVPEQAPVPEPEPGFASRAMQWLLKNLGVLLVCAGLAVASGAGLLGNRFSESVLTLQFFPKLPALVPAEQPAMLVAIACLLLLLSINGGSRQHRNTPEPTPPRAG